MVKELKVDVFNAFDRRRERNDAGSSRAGNKTLRCQARAHSAGGLADVVRVAHVAQAELVHRGCAEGLGMAQTEELRAS